MELYALTGVVGLWRPDKLESGNKRRPGRGKMVIVSRQMKERTISREFVIGLQPEMYS